MSSLICKLWGIHEDFRTTVVRHQISHKLWQDEVHSFFNRFEQAKYAHTRSVLGVVWTHCDLLGAGTLLPWDLLFLQARSPSRGIYRGTSWKHQLSLKSSGKQHYQIWMHDMHGKLATNVKKKELEMELEDGVTWTAKSHRASAQTSGAATSLPDILLQLLSRSLISSDYFGPWSCLNAFAVCVDCFGCHNQVSVLAQLTEINGKRLDSF